MPTSIPVQGGQPLDLKKELDSFIKAHGITVKSFKSEKVVNDGQRKNSARSDKSKPRT